MCWNNGNTGPCSLGNTTVLELELTTRPESHMGSNSQTKKQPLSWMFLTLMEMIGFSSGKIKFNTILCHELVHIHVEW